MRKTIIEITFNKQMNDYLMLDWAGISEGFHQRIVKFSEITKYVTNISLKSLFFFLHTFHQKHIQPLQQQDSVLLAAHWTQICPMAYSQHLLKAGLKARFPEGAHRLQHGFCHRVPQLLEEHPEKHQHEQQQSQEYPHVQTQVPAPADGKGQRGGSHQKFSGGRHELRQHPSLSSKSKRMFSFSQTWIFSKVTKTLFCEDSTAMFRQVSNSLGLCERTPFCSPGASLQSKMWWTCWVCVRVVWAVQTPWDEMAEVCACVCSWSLPPLSRQTVAQKPASQFINREREERARERGEKREREKDAFNAIGCLHSSLRWNIT